MKTLETFCALSGAMWAAVAAPMLNYLGVQALWGACALMFTSLLCGLIGRFNNN